MYVKSTHANGVSRLSHLRALWYSILPPSQAEYMMRLRERFGASAQLHLNTESFLNSFLRNIPERVPGMYVAVDTRHAKRFAKVILRCGLKVAEYGGQKSLGEVMKQPRLLAIIIPDNYEVLSRKYSKQYQDCGAIKIVFQNRKRPRSVRLEYDVYLWEQKQLPRTISGCVAVFVAENLFEVRDFLRMQNSKLVRLSNKAHVKDIRYALKGKENKYRRIDRRPARILPRMLYDFYK